MPPRLNIPPITRILLIALVSQSTLSAAVRYGQWTEESDIVVPYLTLVPQLSLFYPWVFITTTLVESNVFTLGISGATIWYGGRYLERAWTSAEFAKFLLVVSLIPNIVTFLTLVLLYSITGDMHWTLMTVAGCVPLQISFLIAFSQLVPAHTVTLFRGIISLRVPRFPPIYVALITLLTFTPLFTSAAVLLATSSFLVSWTYLRFFKVAFPDLDSSQLTSLRGDASETFAFAEFFPSPIKEPVAAFCDQVYGVLVAVRVCSPFSPADSSSSMSRADGYSQQQQRGVPGSTRAETERRRALALKALDQRLHATTAGAGASAAAPKTQPAAAAVMAPPPAAPSVQTQPQPSTQTAMTSQPESMLGETNYVPEREGTNGSEES